jgi:hypothetical protein
VCPPTVTKRCLRLRFPTAEVDAAEVDVVEEEEEEEDADDVADADVEEDAMDVPVGGEDCGRLDTGVLKRVFFASDGDPAGEVFN